MLILLPPSESKRPGGQAPWSPDQGRFGHQLGRARSEVAEANMARGSAGITMKGDRLTAVLEANVAVAGGLALSLPCHERYDGVVWDALSPVTLDPVAVERARSSVLVASGLGGIFGWDDPVPDYRLKMGTSLSPFGGLARFWSTLVSPVLVQAALDGTDHVVIDLLPMEHAGAVAGARASSDLNWVRVELVGPDGTRSGHAGKAAKGRLARALLEAGTPDLLQSYTDLEGFVLRLEGPVGDSRAVGTFRS